jgi:hypothetical protein
MIERDAESIARGQANVEKVYNGLIAKGRMTKRPRPPSWRATRPRPAMTTLPMWTW